MGRFAGESYVSKFSRSGVAAMSELVTHGYMESDATITDRLRTLPSNVCAPQAKLPHIILVHDESSFDIRVLPGVKVPADYGGHFRSFDGPPPPSCSTGKSWLHFRPPPVDFCGSRLAIGAATERARAPASAR